MNRRRAWELGATALLLLVVAFASFGAVAWRNHVRELNRMLEEALDHNDAEAVAALVRRGADVRTQSQHRTNVMMLAAASGDLALLERCRAAGLPVDAGNQYSLTPLIFAVLDRRVASARWLLDHGADPNRGPNYGDPLHNAVEAGDPDMVRALLTAGAQTNLRDSYDGTTPLMEAAARGHLEIVRLLLAAGADPAYRGRGGRTALDEARFSRSPAVEAVVRAALRQKASGAAGKR